MQHRKKIGGDVLSPPRDWVVTKYPVMSRVNKDLLIWTWLSYDFEFDSQYIDVRYLLLRTYLN